MLQTCLAYVWPSWLRDVIANRPVVPSESAADPAQTTVYVLLPSAQHLPKERVERGGRQVLMNFVSQKLVFACASITSARSCAGSAVQVKFEYLSSVGSAC